MLCLVLPIIYSIDIDYTTIYIDDDFTLSDAYANWTFVGTDGTCLDTPYEFDGHYGFSNMRNVLGGTCINQYIYRVDKEIYYNSSLSNNLIIQMQTYVNADEPRGALYLYRDLGATLNFVMMTNNIYNPLDMYFKGAYGQIEQCTTLLNYGEWNNYTIIFKPTETYDVYQDDTLVCDDVLMHGSWYNFSYVKLLSDTMTTNTSVNSYLVFFDNVKIGLGDIAPDYVLECEYPTIFCDDFDYNDSINSVKDWQPLEYDLALNTNLHPFDKSLFINDSDTGEIYHTINKFSVNYPVSYGVNITSSYYAPAFSNEFDIQFINNSVHIVTFNTYDKGDRDCYSVRFNRSATNEKISVYAMNSTYSELMTTLNVSTNYTIKISGFFAYHEEYNFNTTGAFQETGLMQLYIDGVNYGGVEIDEDCLSVYKSEFARNDGDSDLMLDNYYAYVGYDMFTDTSTGLFYPVYVEPDIETVDSEGIVDLTEALDDDFWCSIGLCTQAAKYILAMFLLFVVTSFIVFMGMVNHFEHISASVVLVDFFMIIMFVYLQLVPVWIIWVLGLISIGLGALYVKSHVT